MFEILLGAIWWSLNILPVIELPLPVLQGFGQWVASHRFRSTCWGRQLGTEALIPPVVGISGRKGRLRAPGGLLDAGLHVVVIAIRSWIDLILNGIDMLIDSSDCIIILRTIASILQEPSFLVHFILCEGPICIQLFLSIFLRCSMLRYWVDVFQLKLMGGRRSP